MADTTLNQNNQYICSQSKNRDTSFRIDLLDMVTDAKLSTLTPQIISGSITFNGINNSNMSQRTGELTLLLDKDLSTEYFKISLRNKVQIFAIIKDNITEIEATYNLGYFIMVSPTIKRSSKEQAFTVKLWDIMSLYDGTFGGGLPAKVTISTDRTISQVIRDTVADPLLMNMTKTLIENNTWIPTKDVEVQADSTVKDLLQAILDLTPNYTMYIDFNGYFRYERIKNNKNNGDLPIQEFNQSEMITSLTVENKDENIRNSVTVWGMVASATSTESAYQVTASKVIDDNSTLSIQKYGRRHITISEDKIQDLETANDRCDYELSKHNNSAQVLTLEIFPDFRLLPDYVVKFSYEDDVVNKINGRYQIDNVNINLSALGLMSFQAHKLYNDLA